MTFLLSVSGGGSTFNNIFDDSEDDDLLDATESPSSKQESAVFSALKTMVLFGGAMIASAVILGNKDFYNHRACPSIGLKYIWVQNVFRSK